MSKKFLVVLAALFVSGVASAANPRHRDLPRPGAPGKAPAPRGPSAFGGTTNVTSIAALGFSPFDSSLTYKTDSLSYFKYFTVVPADFGGSVSLPAGAVIDKIGLGTCDEAGGNFAVYAYIQAADGITFIEVGSFSTSAHGPVTPCLVDYVAVDPPIQNEANNGSSIQLDVYQPAGSPTDGSVLFGSVEVWWHTVVSPAPASPTFNDVPASDFGFQYIEALAASGITGGCGGGNYCPDTAVNRRQMAIFLAKALGLYWPY